MCKPADTPRAAQPLLNRAQRRQRQCHSTGARRSLLNHQAALEALRRASAPAAAVPRRRITFSLTGPAPEREHSQRSSRDSSTGAYLAKVGGYVTAESVDQYRTVVSRNAVLRARLWKRCAYDLPGDNIV